MAKQTACIHEFDESRYPLIYIKHRGKMTTEAMEQGFVYYKRYLARKRPFALVFDARESEKPPGEAMKLLGDFMNQNVEAFGTYCAGIGYALDSVLIRMVVRSLFMVNKPPFAWSVSATPEEAEQWCWDRLRSFR